MIAKINGGAYQATDTADGFFTIHDIPLMSSVREGDKNVPKDIDWHKWMTTAVSFAQAEFTRGKFMAPAHYGHHKIIEISDPLFAGYVVPKNVGTFQVNGEEKPTIFGDVKVTRECMDKILNGRLPYLSVEAHWGEKVITSLSFLDSKPPYFHYPLITIGRITKDPTARFEAKISDVVRFEKDEGNEPGKAREEGAPAPAKAGAKERPAGDEPVDEGMGGGGCCEHCERFEAQISKVSKLMGIPYLGMATQGRTTMSDPKNPNATPVDPTDPAEKEKARKVQEAEQARMQAEGTSAKLEGRVAALEEGNQKRAAAETAKTLETRALDRLKGYQIGDKVKAGIAKFAAVSEAVLNDFVDGVLESAVKRSPTTLGEFDSTLRAPSSDPTVAKFGKDSPERLEFAMQAKAEWEQLSKQRGFLSSADEYVDYRVKELMAKAKR